MQGLFQIDGRTIPGIVPRDGNIANLNMMENPQNSLLSMFCIKKIRKGIRREDELAEVTICYSSPNPNLTMKCFIDRNDKRQGKFTVFDGEAPIITGTFEDDLMKDLITVRNRNGNIVFDGFYRNGKKEGMGTEYVAGVRSFRGNFYNDKRNGPGDVFDSSGQIISSKFYYDGIETPNYVEGDILYVYDEHNCLIKAGEFNPVSFRLDGKGVLYTPGNHNAKLWKAGIFTNGDLDILEREFHDSRMIEYKEQKKIYEGGYWSSNVKEFHRFGDGIEYYDNGAVCVTYYNMNGPHGYFIRGPTIERLLELSIEDIIYNLVDADDCSVCKYENGKMIENWHVLKRRKKADCCSNCCVKTCVCIPKRKKYDASVWLMEHWYLHVIMISLLVGLLIYLLICILKQDCYHGKLVINNDYSWEGQICNEKAYGFGKMYLKNHLYYEGYVVNNMYHGYGNSYYMNGQKEFDGIWHLNSKLNGSYYSEDGYLLYTGLFDVDKYNGFGIAYYPTGTIQYIGEWLNNKIIQGKYFNLLNQTVYEGDFSTSSLINQGCIYYHTGTIMYNFTWDRSNILVGSYYSLIDHFIVNDGYELDMYFKQVYSYEDYAEVDYLIGYFDMKVYDQSSFFDICYYSFLYLLRIDSYIMSHFNSFSIYNNTLLYSITFYSSSSLSFLSDINSVYIFDNPSLSILIFDENTVTDGEVLYLNNLPSLRTLVIGNQRNLNSSNFLKAKQLIISDLPALETIYIGAYSFYELEYLSISNLPNLTSITFFHHSLGNMNCTAVVELNNLPHLTTIYGFSHSLDSVVNLTLRSLPQLQKFLLKGDTCLSSLTTINRYPHIMSSFIQSIQEINPNAQPRKCEENEEG